MTIASDVDTQMLILQIKSIYTAYARFFNYHFSLMSLSTCDDWIKKNLVMPAPNFKNSDLTSEFYSSILSLKYQYVSIL